jgi:hypothetical protein
MKKVFSNGEKYDKIYIEENFSKELDRMKGKIYKTALASVLLTASLMLCLVCCGSRDGAQATDDGDMTELDYSDVDLSVYLGAVTYKGLTVSHDDAVSREDALWAEILKTADMKGYPEDKVEYYVRQTEEYYLYLAGGKEEDIESVLKHYGITEGDVLDRAREYVKKDVVYEYIVKTEGIAVTDTEKAELFDKYVDKYVSDYGYRREYVTANMSEHIYDSMLYDKTMEYLFTCNSLFTNVDE